ncbi:MAG TPA: amino acid adenylation domain-containing protein, partial [Longimicrobium sp.]|nr:amino acid adenylation domain-containing protein [Longimicrobium sp.]
EHGVTAATAVQGAWALLLARRAGEDDVVFGTVVSGRPAALDGVEGMVGMFINTLPTRVEVGGGRPVAAWLREVQERLAAARAHEHVPLTRVQGWSEVPAGTPLFESIVVFENYPVDAAALEGGAGRLGVRDVRFRERSDAPLALVVLPGEPYRLKLAYDPDRFTAGDAAGLLRRVAALLAAFAAEPEAPLDRVSLLEPAERAALLAGWRDADLALADEASLADAFLARAAERPDAEAVVGSAGSESYGALARRSGRLARALAAAGVRPESPVAVLVPQGPALPAAFLAVLRAGGVYVPLDAASPRERLRFLLEDTGARVVLADPALLPLLPEEPAVTVVPMEEPEEAGARDRDDADLARASAALPAALAYLIHTSGSTGRPKGVAVEHRAAAAHCRALARRLALGPGDRVLQFAAPGFDVSVEQMAAALGAGAALVMREGDPWEPAAFPAEARRAGLTVANLPPAYWRRVVQEAPADAAAGLRLAYVGGDTLPPEAVRRWRESAPAGARLLNAYGPTETVVTATLHDAGADGTAGPRVPIGLPLAHRAAYVLDAALEPLPAGVPGELCLGGPLLARGYLDRPALTAERFVPDPFSSLPGARMYRTGDRAAARADGALDHLGRLDRQVKVRGFRIEPGEVEAALRAHPAVRDAVVDARPAAGGETRLAAWYVADPRADPGALELRAFLRARLPEPLVPTAFARLEALPLTPSGKVDRRALPEPSSAPAAERRGEAPRTAAERALAEVWREVLGVGRVGVGDDFFASGGDSLLSLQVVSRARRVGLALTPRQVFEHPTLAAMARVAAPAAAASADADSSPPDEGARGPIPLTPIQRRFFAEERPAPEHWNLSLVLEARGPVDARALTAALAETAARHDALRLRFAREEGEWTQRLAEAPAEWPLERVDLSAVADEALADRMEAEAGRVQRGLSLERGPLARA